MAREIPTIYDSKTVEQEAAALWKRGQYFHADEIGDNPKERMRLSFRRRM